MEEISSGTVDPSYPDQSPRMWFSLDLLQVWELVIAESQAKGAKDSRNPTDLG